MKAIFLTVSFVLTLLIIAPLILTFGIKYLPSGVQPSMGPTKKIYRDINLSQSLLSSENNLAGIGTSIKNPNFASKEDLKVDIYDENNQLLRSFSVSGRNTGDGNFMRLTFLPIEDSKNKKFTFSLTSLSSGFDNSMEVFLTKDNPMWNVELKENGEKVEGNISFITLHKVTTPLEIVSVIFTKWFSRFFSDTFFFVFYIGILILLTSFLLLPIKRKGH